jgi:hypothetical protein
MKLAKKVLTPYTQEQLGHYVYVLRDPRDNQIFYVGKGVGNRVLDHANGVMGKEDPENMKEKQIGEIHAAGLEVDAWIIQSDLKSDEHAFATESAVYGALKLIGSALDSEQLLLKNIVVPPGFSSSGLIQLNEAIAIFGEPADSTLIPHNSVFIKPTATWRRGMSAEELWESTHGWWVLGEERIQNIRYVFSIPNFVIRGVWLVPENGWRKQKKGDRGFADARQKQAKYQKIKSRFGFDSMNDVSGDFSELINKSVEHLYEKSGQKQASVTYLDDQRVKDFKRQGRKPFWNVT